MRANGERAGRAPPTLAGSDLPSAEKASGFLTGRSRSRLPAAELMELPLAEALLEAGGGWVIDEGCWQR